MSEFLQQAKEIVYGVLAQSANGQRGKARVRINDFSKLNLSLSEVQEALTELEVEKIISNVKIVFSEVQCDLLLIPA